MRFRWIVIVQLWACTALATEPGKDFSADITWPLYAQRIGQADDVAVHVQVQGCDDAQLALQSRQVFRGYVAAWKRQSVEFTSHQAGVFITDVDLLQHVGANRMACFASAEAPMSVELQVVATCKGDGREAVSRTLPVQYAVADAIMPAYRTEQQIVIDANHVLALGRDSFAILPTWPAKEGHTHVGGVLMGDSPRQTVGFLSPIHESLVVGTNIYVSDMCEFPYCQDLVATDPVTGVEISALASAIFRVDSTADNGNLVTGVLQVPGRVVRMIEGENNSVLVLSTKTNPSPLHMFPTTSPGWVLSRIDGNRVSTVEVDTNSIVLQQYAAGGAAMVSQTGDVHRLHNLRFAHESQIIPLPGTPPMSGVGGLGWNSRAFSIAPDISQWIMERGDGLWLSDGMQSTKLYTPQEGFMLVDLAWQQDVVAVTYYCTDLNYTRASRDLTVFFDRHTGTQVGSYVMPETWAFNLLARVTALSDHRFAVSGSGIVAIVDEHGNRLAATRVPSECQGPRWVEQLPDGRLLWTSGTDWDVTTSVWDINPYQPETSL